MIDTAKVAKILGIDVRSDMDLISAIEGGLPVSSLDRVSEKLAPEKPNQLFAMIVPPATLKRRRHAEKRMAELVEIAEEIRPPLQPMPSIDAGNVVRFWLDGPAGKAPYVVGEQMLAKLIESGSKAPSGDPKASLKAWRAAFEIASLSRTEGQKVARTADVWSLATEIYGDERTARTFLERPHPLLNNRTPLDVAIETDVGGQKVKDILLQVQYGTAA